MLKKQLARAFSTSSRSSTYDTVIIGGGAMGSSIAYHLSLLSPERKIAVVERDYCYRQCSSTLSAGGFRQQFSLPENIRLSMFGAEFLKNMNSLKLKNGDSLPDIQVHENGYLFLASDAGKDILLSNNETQVNCGVDWMALMNPKELQDKFPWLNIDDIVLGSLGLKNEGFFDPWAYISGLKKLSIDNGVDYISGEVFGASFSPVCQGSSSLNIDSLDIQLINTHKKTEKISINTKEVVNSSGAWSGILLQSMLEAKGLNKPGIARIPVMPRKRCIFTVHCQASSNFLTPPSSTPLVVDTSGAYFRPEGDKGRFICGISPSESNDPDCRTLEDLDSVDHYLFEEKIWPSLATRVPAFEALRVQSSWAGFYEYNTFDHNGIIGFHSEIRNMMICSGFSGHGIQQVSV